MEFRQFRGLNAFHGHQAILPRFSAKCAQVSVMRQELEQVGFGFEAIKFISPVTRNRMEVGRMLAGREGWPFWMPSLATTHRLGM